jgi:hypothetical protein
MLARWSASRRIARRPACLLGIHTRPTVRRTRRDSPANRYPDLRTLFGRERPDAYPERFRQPARISFVRFGLPALSRGFGPARLGVSTQTGPNVGGGYRLDGGNSRAWRSGAVQSQASISWLLVLHFCRSRTEDKSVSNRMIKCGSCGQLNSETALYCVPCDAQFTGQEAVTEEPQKASPSSMDVAAPKQACPVCGTINEAYSELCSGLDCGRDLRVAPSMPTRLLLIAGKIHTSAGTAIFWVEKEL